MEQFQIRGPERRNIVTFCILVFLCFILLVLSTRSLTGVPERIGLSFFSFFQGILNNVGNSIEKTVNAVAEIAELRQKYYEVIEKLESLRTIERDLSDIRLENIRLKEQLGFTVTPEFRKIAGEIIAKDPEGLFSTFIINKGTKDGVKKDQAVIAYQNGIQGLVGKVLEASTSNAIIIPIYDSSTFVSARIQRSRYEGLINGSGSKDFPLIMEYVRKRAKDEVQFGDVVITSGLQSIYPRDILIGRITKLIYNEFETSVKFDVEPVIDYGNLEYVFIIEPVDLEKVEGIR